MRTILGTMAGVQVVFLGVTVFLVLAYLAGRLYVRWFTVPSLDEKHDWSELDPEDKVVAAFAGVMMASMISAVLFLLVAWGNHIATHFGWV